MVSNLRWCALTAALYLSKFLRNRAGRLAAACLRRHPRHDPASIGFVDDAARRVTRVDRVKYVIAQTGGEACFGIVELTHIAYPEVDAGHTGMSQRKRERHLRKRHTRLARNARKLLDHVELALIAGSRQVKPRAQDRIMLAPLTLYEACPRIAWDR